MSISITVRASIAKWRNRLTDAWLKYPTNYVSTNFHQGSLTHYVNMETTSYCNSKSSNKLACLTVSNTTSSDNKHFRCWVIETTYQQHSYQQDKMPINLKD